MIDTSRIQLKSLMNFMKALGYEYSAHPTEKFFYTNHPNLKEIANISFNTAVKLHNGTLRDWSGHKYFKYPFNKFTPYQLHVAFASKIVYNVKLQYSKKNRIILTQSHVVKFKFEDYVKEFLGDDYV